MKKTIKVIIISFLLSCLFVLTQIGQVYADDKGNSIRLEDEAPSDDLVPVPTPSPLSEENGPNDTRSWTMFEHNKLIAETADKYNLDPQLIYATIMTESNGKADAYRFEPKLNDASHCMGQILTSTAKMLGFDGNVSDLYKPVICIDLIGRYHRLMLDKHGNLSDTQLATAYNTGNPRKIPRFGYLKKFNEYLSS